MKLIYVLLITSAPVTVTGFSVSELDDGLLLIDGAECARPFIADPDGDGVYFALEVYGGYVLSRYDFEANKVSEIGIPGIPLGTAFDGGSLVIEDEGRTLVIDEETYETEGVAGGKPVAFFGGNSQIYLRDATIRIGNLYEGKSSRVDFDLGDFDDIFFYPISLKKIYFQVIRDDGSSEIYKISAEKGGFDVSPVEGSGLIIDTESRYSYFGGR